MGADTTATQLIFFIAASVVATATAGIFTGVVSELADKAEQRADAFGDELISDITIINDPDAVVTSPDTIFYIKNTGGSILDYGNMTVVLDGTVVDVTTQLLGSATRFGPGAVAEATYAATLSSGDHRVSISMENGARDEMRFRI